MVRRKFSNQDLTRDHLDLLAKALTIPQNHFLCFGRFYYVLYGLNLVDKENQLTNDGITMARAWMQYREEERSEKAKAES